MRIGITIGDQAGVGLEIIKKSIPLFPHIDFLLIGEILNNVEYGKVNAICGRKAGEAIKEAIELASKKEIDAVVTAPINKEAFSLGGWQYAGHTEMFADLTNTENYSMMLIHKNLRVVHVTTHLALRKAIYSITPEKILNTILVANEGCKQLGIENPKIAVAALNPHGSDGGLFGCEEEMIIQPAIGMARIRGLNVYSKPIPADVVFARAYGGEFDCVVAMYHDQGHIPVKTLGFKWENGEWVNVDGVNVTLGLPIIRTSPDHGVAFGKAGKGIADPTSMISAIKIAEILINNGGTAKPKR
jgi:4-hydroxythreonine-4-phosphate dehydrogenase